MINLTNSRIQANKLSKDGANIPGDFIREGLTAVVSVKVPEPEFEGQTKTRLGNPEVRQIVDAIVSDGLTTLFEWNPNVFTLICNRALEAQAAANAAKAARDMVRNLVCLYSCCCLNLSCVSVFVSMFRYDRYAGNLC